MECEGDAGGREGHVRSHGGSKFRAIPQVICFVDNLQMKQGDWNVNESAVFDRPSM